MKKNGNIPMYRNILEHKAIKDCDIKEKITPQLYFCVNEAARAFELLEIKKYKSILGNIIYLGLEETFLKELNNERPV